MIASIERVSRGIPGFPLGFYSHYRAQPNYCVTPLHYHDDLEFILPTEGRTLIVVEGEMIRASPGQLYFINPGEVHALYSDSSICRYQCIVLPRKLLELPADSLIQSDLLTPLYEGRLQFCRVCTRQELMDQFQQITELCQDIRSNAPVITARLLLFLALCQQGGQLKPGRDLSTTPVHRAISFMQEHLSDRIDLASIAASAGMSTKYFCTYFKKRTGTTPVTYLTSLRIRRAQILLRQQNISVLEVSSACGFENLSFFIKKFKQATGCTPGQYRKNAL